MNAPFLHDRPEAIDVSTFRAAFRRLVGGVSVITVGRGETRTGLTATSVASLSSDPPSLTFNLSAASSTWGLLARERRFGVNFLAAHQQSVAERFSGVGGPKGAARYEGAEWTTSQTGAPLLIGALAALDCEVEDAIERHGHVIVVGRILAARLGPADGTGALVYACGSYRA